MLGRLLAIALLIAPAADAAVLTAEAGLDGVGRPGRWLPVRVTVDARTEDIAGELVVTWGGAHARRDIVVPAPSRRDFDLYVRTGDVRDVVTVRVERSGREVARVTVPVRIAGEEDRAALPVRGGRFPLSWRGYDAADEVIFDGAGPQHAAHRDAYLLWRGIRRAGDMDRARPAAEPLLPASAPSHYVQITLVGYVLAIAAAAFLFGHNGSRTFVRYAVMAVVVIAGSTAAWASGRSSAVVVRHRSYAEQFDGATASLVSMRAIAQYPSNERFTLRVDTTDAIVDAEETDPRFDADGRPVFEREAGIGMTAAFNLEATADFHAFNVTRTAGRTTIVNATALALENCRFPEGIAEPTSARLMPGESVSGTLTASDADPIAVCRFEGTPVQFSESKHPVTTAGTTLVVYHFARDLH